MTDSLVLPQPFLFSADQRSAQRSESLFLARNDTSKAFTVSFFFFLLVTSGGWRREWKLPDGVRLCMLSLAAQWSHARCRLFLAHSTLTGKQQALTCYLLAAALDAISNYLLTVALHVLLLAITHNQAAADGKRLAENRATMQGPVQ